MYGAPDDGPVNGPVEGAPAEGGPEEEPACCDCSVLTSGPIELGAGVPVSAAGVMESTSISHQPPSYLGGGGVNVNRRRATPIFVYRYRDACIDIDTDTDIDR